MRTPFISFCLLLGLVSCSTREPVRILDGYEIPFTSGKHTRYTYHRLPENDTIIRDYSTSYQDDVKFVTEISAIKGQRDSFRKFRVTPKGKELVELIHYSLDSSTNEITEYPGEIVESSETEDGKRYMGGEFTTVHHMFGGFAVRTKNTERFVSEQSYRFNGREVPSLRFESNFEMRTYNRFFPLLWTTTKYSGHVTFSKGIGITHFRIKSEDGMLEHKLISWETFD